MNIKKLSKGFTMLEILIVSGIIVMLFGSVIVSSYVLREQIAFNSAVNNMKNIADAAKNHALSTISYPDTTDYDGDGKSCPPPEDPATCSDKILPNGYILNFDGTGETVIVSLYADVFDSVVNTLDPDKDKFIQSVEMPKNVNFSGVYGHGGTITDLPGIYSMIYTVANSELYLLLPDVPPAKENIQIYLTQTDPKGEVLRDKYIFFHTLNNTAQITDVQMLKAVAP